MKALSLLAAAAALLPTGALAAADLSALWIVSTNTPGMAATTDCNVLQVGDLLFGSCEPEAQGAVPTALLGQVNAAKASWAYDIPGQAGPTRVQYQADVTSNAAMSGTITVAGASSTFSAVRK